MSSELNSLISHGAVLLQDIEPILGVIEELVPKSELDILSDMPKLPHRRTDIEKRGITPQPAITPGIIAFTTEGLSSTKDIQITQEIVNLANQLSFDPIEIFTYVRNKIDYQPYFGSVKGSLGTYWEKAGNDIDQASLL